MIMGKSITEIILGSYTMQLLFVTSVIALALIIERAVYFLKNRFDYFKFVREIEALLRDGDKKKLERIAYSKNTPVHRVLRVAVDNLDRNEEELRELLSSQVQEEVARSKKFLGGLATIVAIAPLLGLYGTVVGLITAFHNIAVTGSGGPEVVGGGIAEALLTTQFGLLIAIPALIFYNYYAKKTEDIEDYLEALASKIVSYRKILWNKMLEK